MTAATPYRTAPEPLSTMPSGIPFIIGNEAAERFSFYGMKAILTVYLTQHLTNSLGQLSTMNPEDAKSTVHLFVALAYGFSLPGAILSDWAFGKYRTIIWLSLVYCMGHVLLAAIPGRAGLWCGLLLISLGAGGIKPCVSAHVGDQFGEKNQHLLSRVFGWFYFSVNAGATVAFLVTPWLLDSYGPEWAFGLPAILMGLATYVFWSGRNKFVHIPPAGATYLREAFTGEGLSVVLRLIPLFLLVSIFWALFDQTGSAWVLQAEQMDRNWLGFEWKSSQIGAVNSIFVLMLIPVFSYLVYPILDRVHLGKPLTRAALGAFVMVLAFGISAWTESEIRGGRVEAVSSKSDSEKWSARYLLDGDPETSWLSSNENPNPVELTLRLRENRAWEIDHVELHAVQKWRREESTLVMPADDRVRPVRAEVLIADAPKGSWQSVAETPLTWTDGQPSTIRFPAATARYVRVVLTPSDGKTPMELADIRVLAIGDGGGVGNHSASETWPDVAAVGYRPSIGWQLVAYFFLTCAEVMISITCLEFSYTQAPNRMKSLIMSLYLLSVSLGNLLTSVINQLIKKSDGTTWLPGASYYWFFTGMMFVAALGFIVVALTFRERAYIQESQPAGDAGN